MPYRKHKTVFKNIRQNETARIRNRSARFTLRSAIKEVLDADSQAKGEEALKKAASVIDRNVKTGIIHKNNAANKKSRLAHHVAGLKK